MTILAITVYAGSEKLVAMTEDMLRQFHDQLHAVEPVRVVAINNGAERRIDRHLAEWHGLMDGNEGFAKAVNLAIKREMGHDITHVLVMNNDLQFPDKAWLPALLKEREGGLVLSPCTDRTATKEAMAEGARDIDHVRCKQVSAFCWLVPAKTVKLIHKKFRFELFDPEFFAYGEDDFTGAVLRKLISPKPFKVVLRSWVRHLKAQTGSEMKMHGGMSENVNLLKRKMKAKGLR